MCITFASEHIKDHNNEQTYNELVTQKSRVRVAVSSYTLLPLSPLSIVLYSPPLQTHLLLSIDRLF